MGMSSIVKRGIPLFKDWLLTVQPVSPQPAEGSAKPPATETLTLHVVHPAADAEDSGEAELRDLEACGARWKQCSRATR